MKLKLHFDKSAFFDKVAGEGKLKLFDEAESLAIRCSIITSNLHDTFQGNYNKKRQIIQVVVIISMWMTIFFWVNGFINYQTHKDPTALYNVYYYGNVLGKDQVSLTTFLMLMVFLGNYYHLIMVYMVYTGKFVAFRPIFDWAEGKPAGLNRKYDRLFRILTNLVLVPFYKFICPILDLSIILTVFLFIYSSYEKSKVKHNILLYILFALYYSYVAHLLISSMLIVGTIINGHSIYLRFRFSQASELFRSKKLKHIRRALIQHQELCSKVDQFNKIVSKPMVISYILFTFAIDTLLYLTLYGENAKLKILTGFGSLVLLFGAFYTYCTGALFTSEAHSPYANANSFIVKRMKKNALTFRSKWKILNFIERISGPTIGIYCWDAFPFDYYSFYEFVCFVLSQFILVVGLFKN